MSNIIPKTAEERKRTPVFSGVLKYFPLAIMEVSRVSLAGNEQHHPGEDLWWDKSKSIGTGDEVVKHIMDHGMGIKFDTDGQRHLGKAVWRALELLQRELEKEYGSSN